LIGTNYGGWVVPVDRLNSSSICYCAGCGEDISFDIGLIELFNCKVYAFDPTPRSIDYVNKNFSNKKNLYFFDIGLWYKEDYLKFYQPKNQMHVSHSILNLQKTDEYFVAKVKRLRDILKNNNHNKIDLLKLDIEGAEYKVIDSIIEDNIKIDILCIEFDECYNPLDKHYKKRIKNYLNKLQNYGFRLVHSSGMGNYTFLNF
jgi:FkbM family methyltransferase